MYHAQGITTVCSIKSTATSVTECVPVRNKTITVEGPNGVCGFIRENVWIILKICYNIIGFEAVETIEECGCRNTTCYRIDHFQSFSERKMDPNNTTFMREELVYKIDRVLGPYIIITLVSL